MKKIAENRSSITLVSNNLKLFGVLHIPEGVTYPVPAVLFCHGFGGNKSGKFRLCVKQAERLSQAGIASLRIDFRGCGDSEGDFRDTTFQTQLEDARIALKFLLDHPDVDSSKIAICARSLGGAVGTQLASEFADIKAVALWCPFFDAKPWLIAHKNNTKDFQFLGQTLTEECIGQFASINTSKPLTMLKSIPMLIVRAGLDEILTHYHNEQYQSFRIDSPKTQYLELANSNHSFANVKEQQILLDTTTSFLRGIL